MAHQGFSDIKKLKELTASVKVGCGVSLRSPVTSVSTDQLPICWLSVATNRPMAANTGYKLEFSTANHFLFLGLGLSMRWP